MENILTKGDPMEPKSTDIITQFDYLDVGKLAPKGWRVLTGDTNHYLISRVAYRHEIEADE